MEEPMKGAQIPQTDSIKELAEFWDSHEITDFEDQMEEVNGPVFDRGTTFKVHFVAADAEVIEELAREQGIGCEQLLRKWVLEKIGKN